MRRTLVPSISTSVASNGGSITAPTVNCSSGAVVGRAAGVDVAAQKELRPRVGPQLRLEVGAVHEVARVRQAGCGDAGRFGQDREVRGDDDEVGLSQVGDPTDVLRRRRAAADADTGPPRDSSGCSWSSRIPCSRAQSANSSPRRRSWFPPTVASGATSAVASRANMCSRSLGFANWTMSPSSRISSTSASANHASAASVRSVEVLGLEDVDPARACRLELAVEVAEDADTHRE